MMLHKDGDELRGTTLFCLRLADTSLFESYDSNAVMGEPSAIYSALSLSIHCSGMAASLHLPHHTNLRLSEKCRKMLVPFNTL